MQKTEKSKSVSDLILVTAGKTAAVVGVLLVLFCALFILLAPGSTSDFFYTLGMKKPSAALAYTQAEKSNDFDGWWNSLVKSVDAKSWNKAYYSAERLQTVEKYGEKISDKKITVIAKIENNNTVYSFIHGAHIHKNDGTHTDVIAFDARYFVRYNYAKSGVLAFKDEENRTRFLEYAIKDLINLNGWGNYIELTGLKDYSRYTVNPLKGYIDALCEDTTIPLGNTMSVLSDLYNHSGRFKDVDTSYYSATNWYSSKKKDMATYVVKLCRARPNDPIINSTDRYFWHSAAGIPMPSKS